MKYYVPITILILAIGAFFFFCAIQEKARTKETEVETIANKAVIDYENEIEIFNELLVENGRTVLGDPVVSDDKQFIIVDTTLVGSSDYDNSITYLYDARNSKLHELKGRLASNLQTTFWMVDYENDSATWYSIDGNEPQEITTYFIGDKGFFDFLVSPNENLTAISEGGISIINQEGEVKYLDSTTGSRAEIWTSNENFLYTLVPDPDRDMTNPLEELYGPQEYMIKKFTLNGKNEVGFTSEIIPYDNQSPRSLEWIDEDTVMVINSGFDDGSFDEILNLNTGDIFTIGDTSGALGGRYIDEKNNYFILAGEFYPEDYVFEQNDTMITRELRIYDKEGNKIYQHSIDTDEYIGIDVVGYGSNNIYFTAQKKGGPLYVIAGLDTKEDDIREIGEPSVTYMSANLLGNRELLSVNEDHISYVDVAK